MKLLCLSIISFIVSVTAFVTVINEKSRQIKATNKVEKLIDCLFDDIEKGREFKLRGKTYVAKEVIK